MSLEGNEQVARKVEGDEAGCSSVWRCTGCSEGFARMPGL